MVDHKYEDENMFFSKIYSPRPLDMEGIKGEEGAGSKSKSLRKEHHERNSFTKMGS